MTNSVNSLLEFHIEVKVNQSCLTLCDPMDHRVHGLLQARILEWVAVPSSRGSSQSGDQTQVSSIAGRLLNHQGSPRILEWVASPLCNRSSWSRNWTRVFCPTGEFFTSWATLYQNSISKGNWEKLNPQVLLVIFDRDHFLFIFVPLSLIKCLIQNM